ncbi:MAG: cupin 2, barrel [uncultured bacterium]|nr:MAG: cupin 2, barrel [uncultured bacterium]
MIKRKKDMVVEQREKMRGGDGVVFVEHFFKPEEIAAKSRLCARLSIPKGGSIGLHQHNGEDEVYIILKGQGLLYDGISENEVSEGDAILTGKGESHSIKNSGNDVLEMIAVIMCY